MCVTLPMGFSHAVYIATCAHQHILYRSLAISPEDSILTLASPAISHDRAVHGIVVDDFFVFSLNRMLLDRIMRAVLDAYAAAGPGESKQGSHADLSRSEDHWF